MPRKAEKSPRGPRRLTAISNGVGASDDNSGGGNASGIPDADTAMRPGGSTPQGNPQEDRRKLFPDERLRKPRQKKAQATQTKRKTARS